MLDGRHAFIRPVLPRDLADLRRAVERADSETLRARFLGARPPRSAQEFRRLVSVDYEGRLALVAFAPTGQGIAIARYERLANSDTAEVAVAVDPAWRHVGLATELVQLLAEGAVAQRLRHFTAEFFANNLDVADLLTDANLPGQLVQDSLGVTLADIELPHDGSGG